MDVAGGPCVPLPGRKTSVVSVHHQQGPERPEQMETLFTVLTGCPAPGALSLEAEVGDSQLFRCSDEFIAAMAEANRDLVRLSETDRSTGGSAFEDRLAELDEAWLAAGNWHSGMISTRNRLMRLGRARIAEEKGQPLLCWYGPPVRESVVVSGRGP